MEQTKSRVRIRLNGNIIDEFEVKLKLQERHHCEYIISDVHRRQPKIRNLNLSDGTLWTLVQVQDTHQPLYRILHHIHLSLTV